MGRGYGVACGRIKVGALFWWPISSRARGGVRALKQPRGLYKRAGGSAPSQTDGLTIDVLLGVTGPAPSLHSSSGRRSRPGGVPGVEVHVVRDVDVLPYPTQSLEDLNGKRACANHTGPLLGSG